MSSYENYSRTSRHYDLTRTPVGVEIILGCLALAHGVPDALTLVDAGCGTGSYTRALAPHVGRIEALDINPAMLDAARRKLERAPCAHRVRFHRAAIDAMPLAAASADGIMVNQVLHHLDDTPAAGYPVLRGVLGEIRRVLRPAGSLVVNLCSTEQLRRGWWYYTLIPRAVDDFLLRSVPVRELIRIAADCGFDYHGRSVPIDATMQGRHYFDASGPLRQEWRDGDSIWACVSPDELDHARATIRDLAARGALDDFLRRHDAGRRSVGQFTFAHFTRRA